MEEKQVENTHTLRLRKENDWYSSPRFCKSHFLNKGIFRSDKRNEQSYIMAKNELFCRIPFINAKKILLAPCGSFADLPWVQERWPDATVYGTDVSWEAIHQAPRPHPAAVSDIRDCIPFSQQYFDIAISTLFFHHVADEGFLPYLRELRRVLRPAGLLVTMEPSWLHPLFWITRPLKKLIGNITGQVEHEHPIFIWQLQRVAREAGFSRVTSFACSFSHNRLPTSIGRLLNGVLHPLFGTVGIKHMGWLVGMVAQV